MVLYVYINVYLYIMIATKKKMRELVKSYFLTSDEYPYANNTKYIP